MLQALKDKGWRGKSPEIILFSSTDPNSASNTIKALNLGAIDFIPKPTSKEGMHAIEQKLVPVVQARLRNEEPPPISSELPLLKPDLKTPRSLLLIASSTGGPKALKEALEAFPSNFPVPIVVIQHMPPAFTKNLASNLNDGCRLTVQEAAHNSLLMPGNVYIAPGGHHIVLSREYGRYIVKFNDDDPIFGLKPAADITFVDMAKRGIHDVVVAVFTGMGSDGAKGCEALNPGGTVFLTQTADSSTVYSMPRAVDRLGLSQGRFAPEGFYDCVRQYPFAPPKSG